MLWSFISKRDRIERMYTGSDSRKPMMLSFLVGMLFFCMVTESNAQLSENFYASTCPNVELIVRQAVTTKYQQTPITAPGTLRMFFHDCFVDVCTLCCDLEAFLVLLFLFSCGW